MAINLLELMQSAVGNQLVDRLAGIAGEDAGGAQKAVGALLPSVLGGLIGKSSTAEGADQLAGVLGQADGTIIDNIGKILDGADGGSDRLQSMGQGLADGLLGDKLGGVLDIISKTSGIGKGGAGSILNLVLPLVFSVLGKQTSSLGLNPAGIAKLLADQSEFLKGMLPKGMSGLLGLGDEFDAPDGILDAAASAVTGVAGDAKDGLANAAGAVGDVAGDAKNAVTGAAGSVASGVGNIAGDAKDAVTGAAGSVASGVGNVAGDAKDAVAGAASSVAGGVGNAADSVASGVGNAADATVDTVKKGGGLLKILFPIILLIALALLALKFLPSLLNKGPDVAPAAAEIKSDNALDSIKGVLNETSSTFTGITDEASAKAAVPKFEALTGKVKAINGLSSSLPEEMNKSIASAIVGNVDKMESLAKKAYAIPGVEAIIGPKVADLSNALNQFGQ